jgi:UDP-glucose 4-epimerase
MSKVLVTGGAGYIGSTAVAMLLEAGFEVSVLDDLSMGHRDAVDPRADFTEGSILDISAVRAAITGCDAVIHFAGKSLVGESVQKPDLYMHVNVYGSSVLLEVMKEVGVKKIVFSSSAATYGEPRETPITESSPTDPTNPYGLSKLKVDQLLTERAASDEIAAISLRYFNVAGALQTSQGWLAERHDPETHLIPNVIKANDAHPLKIFGTDWPTPDKTCIRDYIHVVDLIDAHIKALGALVAGKHSIINLGSGDGYSVREVVETTSKVVGREIPAVEEGRRAGDPAVLIASVEKAEEILKWKPTRNLEAMISDAYAALR